MPRSAAHGLPHYPWLSPAPSEEAESRGGQVHPQADGLERVGVASLPVLGWQTCACWGRPSAEGMKERRLQVCR